MDPSSNLFKTVLVVALFGLTSAFYIRQISSFDLMKCSYGERGSLTATCVNATASYFKNTPYRFDHLDESLRCVNCSLQTLDAGTFDISGNQIRNLDLSNSLITNIRQRAFVGLVFLDKLILAHNDIKTVYPGTFTGVKKITEVDLQNNSITLLTEDGFSELRNLKKLRLNNNHIANILVKAFNGLENLEILDLSNNEIANVKEVFNNLTTLQLLDLTKNKISDFSGDDFNNLTSLLEIRLGQNFIKSIPALEFKSVFNIKRLDLSFNLIDRLIAGSFEGLFYLESLDISHNNVAEIPQKTLQNLHGLHSLNVSNNKLTTFQTGLYSGLPQLRFLNLSHNSIEEIDITGVFSLHSLHTLDFASNNITDVDYIELISRLPRISYLNLEDNLLPCDLEKEMNDFFSEDNFKFLLFRNEVGAVKCTDNPRSPRNLTLMTMEKIVERRSVSSSGTSAWMIVLICLTLILVGILYFTQFTIYKMIKQSSLGNTRAMSEVNLISSELESRDNDYLKE